MTSEEFHQRLQQHISSFAAAVATNEGDWIIKGFIDVYQRIYTISVDTKIVSKVLELLLIPFFQEFAQKEGLLLELCPQQNFYPDLSFIHASSGNRFAVDIKSTYRKNTIQVNGMTLGAFTGYFRERTSRKNTLYPYAEYAGHFVLGIIYSQAAEHTDERKTYRLDELASIPSVIRDFQFFAQPKYRLAKHTPGSGNTCNIGSVTSIQDLINGAGPFAALGEAIYDDYWMHYLTEDMANKAGTPRPYNSLKTYADYKKLGSDIPQDQAAQLDDLDPADEEGTV